MSQVSINCHACGAGITGDDQDFQLECPACGAIHIIKDGYQEVPEDQHTELSEFDLEAILEELGESSMGPDLLSMISYDPSTEECVAEISRLRVELDRMEDFALVDEVSEIMQTQEPGMFWTKETPDFLNKYKHSSTLSQRGREVLVGTYLLFYSVWGVDE